MKRIMDRLVIEDEVFLLDDFSFPTYEVGFGEKYKDSSYEYHITDEDTLGRFEGKIVRVTIEVIE